VWCGKCKAARITIISLLRFAVVRHPTHSASFLKRYAPKSRGARNNGGGEKGGQPGLCDGIPRNVVPRRVRLQQILVHSRYQLTAASSLSAQTPIHEYSSPGQSACWEKRQSIHVDSGGYQTRWTRNRTGIQPPSQPHPPSIRCLIQTAHREPTGLWPSQCRREPDRKSKSRQLVSLSCRALYHHPKLDPPRDR